MTCEDLELKLNNNLKKISYTKILSYLLFILYWIMSCIYLFEYTFPIHKIKNEIITLNINLIVFQLYYIPLTIFLLLIVYFIDKKRVYFELNININTENDKRACELLEKIGKLIAQTELILYKKSSYKAQEKYSGGASTSNETDDIKVLKNNLYRVKSNVLSYSLEYKDFQISFLNLYLILYFRRENKYYVYNTIDFLLKFKSIQYIWEEKVPKDSLILEYTWKYLNSKGGPDKRFNNNYQIPVIEFNFAKISTPQREIELFFSNSSLRGDIKDNIAMIGKIYEKK